MDDVDIGVFEWVDVDIGVFEWIDVDIGVFEWVDVDIGVFKKAEFLRKLFCQKMKAFNCHSHEEALFNQLLYTLFAIKKPC